MKESKRTGYSKELPRTMYRYFATYADSGAPSFCKFAISIGVTPEQLRGFRRHSKFDRAYRECSEIRRDYLIDNGLTRRIDPSLVKFLLDLESDEELREEGLEVRLEVVEQ